MRGLTENKAMQDDMIQCTALLMLGIPLFSGFTGLEKWEIVFTAAGVLLFVVTLALFLWQYYRDKHMSPKEKRELERENRDERSKMLQTMAARYCWRLESFLLLAVGVGFLLRNQAALYAVVYLILVARICVNTAIRWWLERKY